MTKETRCGRLSRSYSVIKCKESERWKSWAGYSITPYGLVGVDAFQQISEPVASYISLSVVCDGVRIIQTIHGKRHITSHGLSILAGKFIRGINAYTAGEKE